MSDWSSDVRVSDLVGEPSDPTDIAGFNGIALVRQGKGYRFDGFAGRLLLGRGARQCVFARVQDLLGPSAGRMQRLFGGCIRYARAYSGPVHRLPAPRRHHGCSPECGSRKPLRILEAAAPRVELSPSASAG